MKRNTAIITLMVSVLIPVHTFASQAMTSSASTASITSSAIKSIDVKTSSEGRVINPDHSIARTSTIVSSSIATQSAKTPMLELKEWFFKHCASSSAIPMDNLFGVKSILDNCVIQTQGKQEQQLFSQFALCVPTLISACLDHPEKYAELCGTFMNTLKTNFIAKFNANHPTLQKNQQAITSSTSSMSIDTKTKVSNSAASRSSLNTTVFSASSTPRTHQSQHPYQTLKQWHERYRGSRIPSKAECNELVVLLLNAPVTEFESYYKSAVHNCQQILFVMDKQPRPKLLESIQLLNILKNFLTFVDEQLALKNSSTQTTESLQPQTKTAIKIQPNILEEKQQEKKMMKELDAPNAKESISPELAKYIQDRNKEYNKKLLCNTNPDSKAALEEKLKQQLQDFMVEIAAPDTTKQRKKECITSIKDKLYFEIATPQILITLHKLECALVANNQYKIIEKQGIINEKITNLKDKHQKKYREAKDHLDFTASFQDYLDAFEEYMSLLVDLQTSAQDDLKDWLEYLKKETSIHATIELPSILALSKQTQLIGLTMKLTEYASKFEEEPKTRAQRIQFGKDQTEATKKLLVYMETLLTMNDPEKLFLANIIPASQTNKQISVQKKYIIKSIVDLAKIQDAELTDEDLKNIACIVEQLDVTLKTKTARRIHLLAKRALANPARKQAYCQLLVDAIAPCIIQHMALIAKLPKSAASTEQQTSINQASILTLSLDKTQKWLNQYKNYKHVSPQAINEALKIASDLVGKTPSQSIAITFIIDHCKSLQKEANVEISKNLVSLMGQLERLLKLYLKD